MDFLSKVSIMMMMFFLCFKDFFLTHESMIWKVFLHSKNCMVEKAYQLFDSTIKTYPNKIYLLFDTLFYFLIDFLNWQDDMPFSW